MKNKKSKNDIVAELSKYSKEALINAFINNNLFRENSLLTYVKHEEFKILEKKQEDLMEKVKKLNPIEDYKEYKKLRKSYEKYSKQIDKLLDL